MDDRAKKSAAAKLAQALLQAAAENQDKVLDDLLRAYPSLTREEAEKMLREEGH